MNTENNKLIAEFMGYKFNAYPDLKHNNITKPNGKDWYYASWEYDAFENEINTTLNYNSDWILLMSVVEKIQDVNHLTSIGMNVNSYNNIAEIKCRFRGTIISIGKGMTRIQALYFAVVEFITWYNKQQPQK